MSGIGRLDRKYLQIDGFRGSDLGSPPLRSSDMAADSRGFGREIDSLPNDEDAGAGALVSP
jgi:hypothetical protein